MSAVAGWYPDPSGAGQLRYWDGQAWTSSTAAAEQPAPPPSYASAPAPAPQAAYGQPTYAAQTTYGQQPTYAAQPGYTSAPQQWGAAPPGAPRGRRKGIYAIVAGVVVVAAVIATVVPLTSGDGHGGVPSVAKLTDKLLTSDNVGAIAAGNFTSAPASDDNSADNSKADCSDNVNPGPGTEKADVGREFTGTGQFAEEDLSYTVGAASLFTQLKTQLAACHKLTLDGGQMALSILKDPLVGGSDDTLAVQASGTISGVDFVFDIVAARFGNGVIEVTYGAPDATAQVSSISNQLLQSAAAKAKSVF